MRVPVSPCRGGARTRHRTTPALPEATSLLLRVRTSLCSLVPLSRQSFTRLVHIEQVFILFEIALHNHAFNHGYG